MTLFCIAAAGVGAVLVFHSTTGPTMFLYSDSQKTYFVDWHSHGTGTVWATYINPVDKFQVESGSTAVTVTLQGSAVSLQTPDASTPTLGDRSGKQLDLSINNSSGFGPWIAGLILSPGSLKDYESAASVVNETAATISNASSNYATQDVADANTPATTSTDGDCILYLSGTDVSITMHGSGADGCITLVSKFPDLSGTWGTQQTGANYPGQASLVCEYANADASEYVVVADAGGQLYGGQLCTDIGGIGNWYQLR